MKDKKTCRTCSHRQRWERGNRYFQYCELSSNSKTDNGLKRIRCKDAACDKYAPIPMDVAYSKATLNVRLDKFELYYLLESCFMGSHLRSDTILRFVDEWYGMLTEEQRACYYEWILRDVYNGSFKPLGRLCGADRIFMARFDPSVQFEVLLSNGRKVNAFLMDGKYYINSHSYCSPDNIVSKKLI